MENVTKWFPIVWCFSMQRKKNSENSGNIIKGLTFFFNQFLWLRTKETFSSLTYFDALLELRCVVVTCNGDEIVGKTCLCSSESTSSAGGQDFTVVTLLGLLSECLG